MFYLLTKTTLNGAVLKICTQLNGKPMLNSAMSLNAKHLGFRENRIKVPFAAQISRASVAAASNRFVMS